MATKKRVTANGQTLDPRTTLDYYTRSAIRNADVWTDANIRREYARLRDIAQKRLERLGRNEPGSFAYTRNVGKYAPTKTLTTGQIKALLPDLAKFIAARTGTVTGISAQRNKSIETLRSHGYTFINRSNIKEFGEYMEESRTNKATRSIGSVEVAEFYGWTKQHGISIQRIKDDFALWLTARKDLYKYVEQRSEEGEEVTADMIIDEFNRIKQPAKKTRSRKK